MTYAPMRKRSVNGQLNGQEPPLRSKKDGILGRRFDAENSSAFSKCRMNG
jgi:hypothetical protein